MVPPELKRAQEILEVSYSYSDVLLLALAFLPEGVNRLTADAGRWNEVVERLKEQLEPVVPGLLTRLHFKRRPPLPPHSDQLDDFFRFLGISGKLEWSPKGNSYYFSESVKEIIRDTRENKLIEHQGAIRLISEGLQVLAIPR